MGGNNRHKFASGHWLAVLVRRGAFICGLLFGSIATNAYAMDRPYLRASAVVIVMGGNDFSENGGTAPFAVDFNLLSSASGTPANDIIAGDGVTMNYNSGRFHAISNGFGSGYEYAINNTTFGGDFISAGPHQTLDANDAYTEFGLDADTDISLVTGRRVSQFLVASNTAFDIYAKASDLVATGDFSSLSYNNISYRLRIRQTGASGVWRHGTRAQNPANGGSGIDNSINDLGDMSANAVKVFDGGRRTARFRGSLLQQSVAFRAIYRLRQTGGAFNNYDFSMGVGTIGASVTYTIYTP